MRNNVNILPVYWKLSKEQLEKVEKLRDAIYVCESAVKQPSSYYPDFPFLIFYTKVKHPTGSHYFGLYQKDGQWMITDAGSITRENIAGIISDTGVVEYSHYRHHYNEIDLGDLAIDGGRDYTKYSYKKLTPAPDGGSRFVTLKVIDGLLQCVKRQHGPVIIKRVYQ